VVSRFTVLAGLVGVTAVAAAGVAVAVVKPTSVVSSNGMIEAHGTASCHTDANGSCSVAHTLGTVPTEVAVVPLGPGGKQGYRLSVMPASLTASRFGVLAASNDGQPMADKRIRFEYTAYGQSTIGDPTSLTTTPPATTTTTVEPTTTENTTTTTTKSSAPPPAGSPGPVCGTSALNGPSTAPAGAVTVPSGNNANLDLGRASTTYWFAPGVHTLGTGEYDQIAPGDNATFIGAPGAVLDGQKLNRYALTGKAVNVTIKYLTVRNFVAPSDEGVVNHDSGNGWTIQNNLMTLNSGAAMMSGAGQKMIGNCLKDNGQYGLNAFQMGDGIKGILLDGNEFVGNNTEDWETKRPGCGCTGAMKFWGVNGADVRNNWIHHNHGPGIWADTNDNDFLIENNLVENNDDEAIFYEISYNATIRNNVLRNNTWGTGRAFANRGDNFPVGAIYLSEAGGDSRIPARTGKLEITGNVLENNWGGIVGWENSDRYCNSPNNTSDVCTLVLGATSQPKCVQPGIASKPLYDDCRWKTQNLDIHGNTFTFDPAKVDGGCPTDYCGHMALIANYGTSPDWSPYKGDVVIKAITFNQNNHWHDNTYTGPWQFMPHDTSFVISKTAWQSAPYNQDAGS
jgi:parallel beta-helix repeat protein